MNRRMMLIFLLGVAAIAIAYVSLYRPAPAQKQLSIEPPGPWRGRLEPVKPASSEGRSQVQLVVSAEAQAHKGYRLLRNPFKLNFEYEKAEAPVKGPSGGQPPAAPPVPKKILVLQGIFSLGDANTAVIDGKNVMEGERVSGWKVHKIYSSRVIVIKGEQTKTLYIKLGVD